MRPTEGTQGLAPQPPNSQEAPRRRLGGPLLAILLAVCLAAVGVARGLTGDDDAGVSEGRQTAAGPPVLGAAVDWDRLRAPGPYRRLFLAHYSSLTPENALKMDALAPTPDGFDFREADELVRWAGAHGVAVHGHALVWHRQAAGLADRAQLVAGRAAGLPQALHHRRRRATSAGASRLGTSSTSRSPTRGKLRSSIWQRVLGDGYVADALRWAREADPDARLYVNEFDVERPGRKSAAMYRLLRDLRDRSVPLDAVGLQAHLTASGSPPPASCAR